MFWKTSKQRNSGDLVGRWVVDPCDGATRDQFGDIALEFDAQGNLTYTIRLLDKDQFMLLTSRVEGNTIITDQPSHPDEQRSEFEITGNSLMVMFGGRPSHFIRV